MEDYVKRCARTFEPEAFVALVRDFREAKSAGAFALFALALAQHYGLPSPGLDVCDSLDVALFFALWKYRRTEGVKAVYERLVSPSEMPVVYILAPSSVQELDWRLYRLERFPATRPDRQAARFLHTSWGYARNACARQIFAAFYLDLTGDYDPIPTPAAMFPVAREDEFARFLLDVVTNRMMPDRITRALGSFYMVEA
jgi:hypothetical protein